MRLKHFENQARSQRSFFAIVSVHERHPIQLSQDLLMAGIGLLRPRRLMTPRRVSESITRSDPLPVHPHGLRLSRC
jgi:hypothetical protein